MPNKDNFIKKQDRSATWGHMVQAMKYIVPLLLQLASRYEVLLPLLFKFLLLLLLLLLFKIKSTNLNCRYGKEQSHSSGLVGLSVRSTTASVIQIPTPPPPPIIPNRREMREVL